MSAPLIIRSEKFVKALIAAGAIPDGDTVHRVVIDAEAGHFLRVYVERYGDERVLEVTPLLAGIEINRVPLNLESSS